MLWMTFGKFSFILKISEIPKHLETRLFHFCITTVLIWCLNVDFHKILQGQNKENRKSDEKTKSGFVFPRQKKK